MLGLDLDLKGTLALDIAAFVGKCVAVLGITGPGKSNTVAVLIEELLAQRLTATIIVLAKSQVFFISNVSQHVRQV